MTLFSLSAFGCFTASAAQTDDADNDGVPASHDCDDADADRAAGELGPYDYDGDGFAGRTEGLICAGGLCHPERGLLEAVAGGDGGVR